MNNSLQNTKECPHCGEQILKKAVLCKHCKKSVETVECPFCAEEIFKATDICNHCGMNLKDVKETTEIETILFELYEMFEREDKNQNLLKKDIE
ncbi:MAG TPA: zinc ribbon domain-containing protein, partial [bacterium]|nr:zinc ribbon domain-containing protein [bacterium]